MRDFVIRVRGDWFERSVYLTIIVILGIWLTLMYLSPAPACTDEGNIQTTETQSTPSTTSGQGTPATQPAATETPAATNTATQTTTQDTPSTDTQTTDGDDDNDDADDDQTETVSTGKVSATISEVLTWADQSSDWGKIKAYRLKIENGLDEDIVNPEIWNYIYDSNDDKDASFDPPAIKLPRIVAGEVFDRNQIVSISADEINLTKTLKVEIRDGGRILAYVTKNLKLQ